MPGDGQGLAFTLDGTGSGNDGQVAVADGDFTHLNQRVFGFCFPTDQFIRLGDRHCLLDPGQADKHGCIHGAFVVQHTNGNAVATGNWPCRASASFNDLDHLVDLIGCRRFIHHHQHVAPPLEIGTRVCRPGQKKRARINSAAPLTENGPPDYRPWVRLLVIDMIHISCNGDPAGAPNW